MKPDTKLVISNIGLHYFTRKKAAVSSLEWQFPHDDYKPRERHAGGRHGRAARRVAATIRIVAAARQSVGGRML